jgi:Fe-S-cluster-containing dehydrogenase component
MEEPVETKNCSMCEKAIETSKFRMHEMGCLRQNYKCTECGACVAKCDKEEHEEEEHV